MKPIEERVSELENKVQELEYVIRNARLNKYPQQIQRNEEIKHNQVAYQQKIEKTERKPREALVGKYIIGALAPLLLFIGAVSLIGLIWNNLTPEIKLLLISSSGIILTVLGFWLMRKKNNPITAIILGTGAGLLFISILSANMSFNLISNNVTIILASIWAIFFILSSKYTNLFFTTIIAYIGSYISLILGLYLIKGDVDLFVMTMFTTIISFVMIINTIRNKKETEIIINTILISLSYSTILFRCYIDGFSGKETLLVNFITPTIVIIILYILMNVFFRLLDKKTTLFQLIFGLFMTITTAFYIAYVNLNYIDIKALNTLLIFFAINLIQMILNYILLEKSIKHITIYYSIILIINSILINIKLLNNPTGIFIVALLLLVCEKIFKQKNHFRLIGIIILLDSLLLTTNYSNEPIFIIFGILQITLIFYLLFKYKYLNGFKNMDLLKIIGIIVLTLNSFSIIRNIEYIINDNPYMSENIGFLISVISFTVLIKLGYFNKWIEGFNLFNIQNKINIDSKLKTFFYIFSTALYVLGLQQMYDSNIWYQQLISLIGVLIIVLIQSYSLILNKNIKNEILTGVWIGIKYLILSWTIISSFFYLDINSVMYSIIGLVVAIACISFGFKFKVKSLRFYGLVLTIIMVIKFIIVDLSQENSIIRVFALIFGGLICFGISLIYNKLNNKI